MRGGAVAVLLALLAALSVAIPSSALAGVSSFPLPRHGGSPIGIARGSDGALWFGEIGDAMVSNPDPAARENRIGRITTAGVITEYGPLQGEPVDIAAGPDGALWFLEVGSANTVSRITTGGTISEYDTGSLIPAYIAAGPDGAMWVTQNDDNNGTSGHIARVRTDGVITNEFGPFANGLANLGAGPDGAVWFGGLSSLRRITSTGSVKSYKLAFFSRAQIPVQEPGPGKPVAGPDGALWFTLGFDKIGRLSTSGAGTAYKLPKSPLVTSVYSAPDPYGLTVGPDGALWFVIPGSNRVGRITTAGAITEYGGLPPGYPTNTLAAGPDGALWLPHTDGHGNNKIVRISTDTPAIVSQPAPGRRKPSSCAKRRRGKPQRSSKGCSRKGRKRTHARKR